MTTYLHIVSGSFGLLVDIEHVVEVSDIAEGHAGNAAGLRPWRERNLAVVDLAAQLGAPGTRPRQQVVLRNDTQGDASCALDVEHVLELLDIDEQNLQPLNDISTALTRLVDCAWPAATGLCLLRLRTPFAWANDGPPTHHGAITP